MTAAVEFKNVTKCFAGMSHPALDDVSLTIDEGELVCVLGTSGGGKTTLIKLINRLHDADSGQVLVEGRDVSMVDPVELRRGIGYVIQQIGLFPHMRVGENIATVPRILKWDRARTAARVDELLDLVGLDPEEFRDRWPSQLSGGQQQRVGLARALCPKESRGSVRPGLPHAALPEVRDGGVLPGHASSSAWAWRAPSPPSPSSCCSTSRSAPSMPLRATSCRTSCCASTAVRAGPSSS
ncbi:ATP-binding cassette domain-containing protein [Collinsella bouchesdurhonensis]|uniref:ATP-binding cassette domain-containing protein n=1 Tax=Collinsella bouchesdurhonensis TaxID=1907654 RepID=UPI000AB1A3B8|nr:ATP-binding cassette domain-containing protein [Collinsella bouchesdurhonensis]